MKTSVPKTYVHKDLPIEVKAIGGYYVIDSETRVPYAGRDLLCLIGFAHVDAACCGVGGCRYVMIPGFVIAWKIQKNQDGYNMSIVEPICDPDLQREIHKLIEEMESIQQVRFV